MKAGKLPTSRPLMLLIAAAATVAMAFYLTEHRTGAYPGTGSRSAEAGNACVNPKLCAGCHSLIAENYRKTGMARSFYRPAPENTVEDYSGKRAFYHQASGTYYKMLRQNGKYFQRRWRKGYQGRDEDVEESEVAFVMGSGNHVRTYLRRTDRGALIELPVAWYPGKGGYWSMNPGYDTLLCDPTTQDRL